MRLGKKKGRLAVPRRKRRRRAPCAWNDLADELVLHVASFLDETSVARLACTDRRTRQVCLDDRLWKRFYTSRIAASAPRCKPKRCMAHRAETHRSAVDRIRRWAVDLSDPSCPLDEECAQILGTGLSRCGHYAREPADHRWACAMDRASNLCSQGSAHCGFARYPDQPYRSVGHIANIDPFALDFLVPGLVKSVLGPHTRVRADYTGDIDSATGVPHGYGVSIMASIDSWKPVCRIAGEWIQGRPCGSMRVWARRKNLCIYYEGGYDNGRRHSEGLLVTSRGVYDSRWSKGKRCGTGFARTRYAHITYAPSSTRAKRQTALVYRGDGSIEFKGICNVDGEPLNGTLFDPAGTMLYRGDMSPGGCVRGNGTMYLVDGVKITGRIKSGTWSRLITIVYPNGDEVECTAPLTITKDGWTPTSVTRFIFSSANPDPLLAGRALDGSWHILQVGPRLAPSPLGYASPDEPDNSFGGHPAMIVRETSSSIVVQPSLSATLDDLFGDDPHGIVHLPKDDPYDAVYLPCDDPYDIAAARALGEFVFWPRAVDLDDAHRIDRDRFLDHMATQHGRHWSTCRAFAATLSW
ncbi:F-box domain containing protein [Pandoravirus salinus]|uniref:F-box domain containing protein n=1 Tax=Pandoravirus salinus TaxID=1349410 RepID=S4VXL2_9VIRU|nr:F-box domain [Pandoravirus salinus]AGO85098.1 F-box domain containing protein [Pandoravirus salinus]